MEYSLQVCTLSFGYGDACATAYVGSSTYMSGTDVGTIDVSILICSMHRACLAEMT